MKKRCRKPVDFKELEAKWYAKLKKGGFQDIEKVSVPGRPLISFHSNHFAKPAVVAQRAKKEKYYRQIEDFVNHNKIHEICKSIAEHGNNSVSPKIVKNIIELHGSGFSERKIAKKIRRSNDSVHRVLVKAREWMKVA